MALALTAGDRAVLSGTRGTRGAQMAMEIVVGAANILGAKTLIDIKSSHVDGCLYHGEAGVLYCQQLADNGAAVSVPTTTNVGGINLLKPKQSRLSPRETKLAYKLMMAHQDMGCKASWTCAPYQAGHRPAYGEQVAWGESNAVAFVNTVLGARTNRYGDFLDIACAISGRAPAYGLHLTQYREAGLIIDVRPLPDDILLDESLYPVLGALVGRLAGKAVPLIKGVPSNAREDSLKALCAGAASTGAAALIHIAGVTPEADWAEKQFENSRGNGELIKVDIEMFNRARDNLSEVHSGPVDCVALGSPHFSAAECLNLMTLAKARPFKKPVYVCTGRHTMAALEGTGAAEQLIELGVVFVIDTCVVVTPILDNKDGVMMTNSAKFSHYAKSNTGYAPVFGTLADCVESAVAGVVVRAYNEQ